MVCVITDRQDQNLTISVCGDTKSKNNRLLSGLSYDLNPTAAIPFFVIDKLTFNGNYKKGKANGGTALTEALLLLLFKK
jgi:hypothetical protein